MSTGGVQHVVDLVVDGTKRLTTNAPPTDAYLKWDSPGVEVIKPDEAEKTAKIKAVMSKMQKRNFDKHRHCFRATHVKTQAIVKGKLQVHSDLPDHLNQGLFQRGASYDLIARYANEPYLLQDDKEPGPRGLGIKIFNVPGPHLEDVDPSIKTQDLLFNNAPMLELTDIDTTLDIMSLREEHFDNPSALGLALRTRTDQMKQLAPYSLPNKHIIGMEMYTQSAFRFGDYYGHIALFPLSQTQKISGEESIDSSSPSSILSEKLSTYFASNSASYEIKIQLGTSTILHPTEDASVVWDESSSPYQSLGTITFPKQESFSHERRVFWEDRLYLSPWRGLEAHRPLGSVNRLRKGVYHNSTETRDCVNANKKGSGDVDVIDEIP